MSAYNTTARVHSIVQEDVLVVADIPGRGEQQVHTPGVTVELIDHNGSCHTHRFLNVAKAREIFGEVVEIQPEVEGEAVRNRLVPRSGGRIECTYTFVPDADTAADDDAPAAQE